MRVIFSIHPSSREGEHVKRRRTVKAKVGAARGAC